MKRLVMISLPLAFRIPFVFKTALFLYDCTKNTEVKLSKHSRWLANLSDNLFNTFQELREFTGKIRAIKNGFHIINRLYDWQNTIPPFLVCFKGYEKGKTLEKSFILKQRTGKPLSGEDEKQLFFFLSNYPNYTFNILLSWNNPDKGFLTRKERIFRCIEREKGRLLEIGCSAAPWLEDFVHNEDISSYIGSDISLFAIRTGTFLHDNRKSKFLQCHAEKLPFKNGSFGIIVASEVMEHLKNPEALCKEAFRILRENGVFVVSVPMHVVDQHNITDALDFGDYTHNPFFPNFQQLKEMFLKTNFVIEDIMIDPYYIFKLRKVI
ncbi:MAG TPA: class I SAM-dependent methyltransferase [Candidatus Wunengus sp. YC60]|uniref:class I SAM-dependent methyltransferase n=1 Tax=Candidatus Wunengus sp. YC60 TaxID=3367697 RepID=UPI0040261C1C